MEIWTPRNTSTSPGIVWGLNFFEFLSYLLNMVNVKLIWMKIAGSIFYSLWFPET